MEANGDIIGSATAVCKFCAKNSRVEPGRYTCPRCNARYCSTDCYKSESHVQCSEAFYRDCFMEGLREMESDATQRQRVVEMLRRLESDDAVEDTGAYDRNDLEERLAGINLDGPADKIWEQLTESEHREFDGFVRSGQLTDIIPLWTPWWTSKSLIEDVSSQCSSKPRAIPRILTNIPDVSALLKTSAASKSIPFSIVNVLYSYAYTARLYNGDHATMAVDSARTIADISESIRRGVFPDAATALASCLSRLETDGAAHAHFVSREYSVAVVRDVIGIVSGPNEAQPLEYVMAGLSDCRHTFRKARHENARSQDEAAADTKRTYFAAEKKLEFFLSWTKSYGHILRSLVPVLELESCELATQLAVHESDRGHVEKLMERRKLAASRQLVTEIRPDVKHSLNKS